MPCIPALSPLESSILLAIADGLAVEAIAEIEGMEADEIHYICARSVSKARHPAFQSRHFTPAELSAAETVARLSERTA